MSYLDWHVGLKVVCVKEGPWTGGFGGTDREPKPKYAEICEVSLITAHDGDVFIGVAGYDPFALFWAKHFRPLQSRQTDIAIFQQMLAPSKVNEREPA